MISIQQSLNHILDNVEIKAKAQSTFTVEIINKRIQDLEYQLLQFDKIPTGRLTPSWKTISDEIEYLRNLKARKGWS